jgi:hypothetical protein
VALQPPETPEGPGWCGQDAARGQHGPAPSGVVSQRPNRLRGLSVEGRCPSRDCGKRQCRTVTPIPRQCQTQKAKTPEREKSDHRPRAEWSASPMGGGGSCAWVGPLGWADRSTGLRKRWSRVACCDLEGRKVVVTDRLDTMSRSPDCLRRGCNECGGKVDAPARLDTQGCTLTTTSNQKSGSKGLATT